MTKEQKIETEKAEINLLLENGIAFEVEYPVRKKPTKFIEYLKPVIETKKETFTVKEPTLGTLDRVAAEQIQIVIDESVFEKNDPIQEAKKMTRNERVRAAKIVALMVLDTDYLIPTGVSGKYKKNNKELNRLTTLFAEFVKPSRLLQYAFMCNTVSNYGAFTNSIRLMSAARTTMPNLIEEKPKV